MTDLEAIRLAGAPREDALAGRLAARIDPAWGFIAYGILWTVLAACIAQAVFLGTLFAVVGEGPHRPPWGAAVLRDVWILAFVLAWLPFAAWVRRRRSAARRLFREGVLLEGQLLSVEFLRLRGAPFTRARGAFQHEGNLRKATLSVADHDQSLVSGSSIPVLFVDGYRYCAVFPASGTAVAAAY